MVCLMPWYVLEYTMNVLAVVDKYWAFFHFATYIDAGKARSRFLKVKYLFVFVSQFRIVYMHVWQFVCAFTPYEGNKMKNQF